MTFVQLDDVVALLGGVGAAGITVWLDGGWCVEALVGGQEPLREHGDLDVAVSREDEPAFRAWLRAEGFSPNPTREAKPDNYVLTDARGRSVDIHVFAFDAEGNHTYGIEYPASSLTGTAVLGGLSVRCIAPEWMLRFKTAYEPAPKDLVDVRALAQKFGFEVPPTHLG
jgi:lincosamide nucleotidyltransferase A/C/D/E